jgi:hypothetical protein
VKLCCAEASIIWLLRDRGRFLRSPGSIPLATAAAATAAVPQDAVARDAVTQDERPGTSASAQHQPAGEPEIATLLISDNRGHCLGRITFENDGPQERRLSSDQRLALCNDIVRESARLEQWCADHGWRHASPVLDVIVADRFRISKSLVPAWNGYLGRMEIPASRAATGKAAIMHELVHILLPNANRFLAEALAIHLQAEIGGNHAFPNFGRPLHGVAREVLAQLLPQFPAGESAWLEMIRLAELDAIATPAPLSLRVGADFYGEDQRGQVRIYPLVGSFARHLVEVHGLERFHTVYSQTPLVPFEQSTGAAGRWRGVYGCSLAELEREWKLMIGGPAPAVAGAAMAPVPELT